jgi:hypothetical protein
LTPYCYVELVVEKVLDVQDKRLKYGHGFYIFAFKRELLNESQHESLDLIMRIPKYIELLLDRYHGSRVIKSTKVLSVS